MSSDGSHRPLATGTPMWTDIPVIDLGRAKRFYETIFGWTFPRFPTDEKALAEAEGLMFEVPDERITKLGIAGNFTRVEPDRLRLERGKVATTSLYMQVDDVDDVLAKIEGAGGRRLGAKEHPPGDSGWMVRFEDPEGNVHGLYSPGGGSAKDEA